MKQKKLSIKEQTQKRIEERRTNLVFIEKKGQKKMDEGDRLRIYGTPLAPIKRLDEPKVIINNETLKYKNLVPTLLNGPLDTPLVTVIIPYNKDRGFLKEAIKSVENQTYKNVELILSYSENGVSFNLNEAIKISSGVYLRYLCEDDILPSDSIEVSVKRIQEEDFDFIHGNSLDFGENTINYVPEIKNPTLEELLDNNVINGGTVLYKRKVFVDYGLFDENLWTGEEYEFNLRLLYNKAKIGYCDETLSEYRCHANQKSIGNRNVEYQKIREWIFNKIRSRYSTDEKYSPKTKQYNIFAAIPVNGRHELLTHTIGRLLNKCGVSKVYCMGDNEEDKKVCEKAGAEWVHHPNRPLGSKWNSGIEAAIKSGIKYDGFLFVGSSDWVSDNWIDTFAPYLEYYDMVGTTNCYFLDINTDSTRRLIHWGGYTNERKGEAIGIGRMYSMRIIKKLGGKVFIDKSDNSMDYQSLQNVLSVGGNVRSFVAYDAKTVSISTNKWVNKHIFENEFKYRIDSDEVNDIEKWLKQWFPEGFKVFQQRIDQVYVSESVESFRKELKEKYQLKNFYDLTKPVFIFGMHRKEDFNFALGHKPHKIIFWCGSDAMTENLENQELTPNDIYQIKNVTHLAGSKFVSDDLTKHGIKHLFVPVTTASLGLPICPRGNDIYFYYSDEDSKDFYGMNYLQEIKSRTKLNIIIAKNDTYTHNQLIDVYKKCFIGVRLTSHDGVPTTGCELGLMGRRIIHNGNQPNCLNYENIDDVVKLINNEYKHRHEDNTDIAKEMRKFLDVGDSWLYV